MDLTEADLLDELRALADELGHPPSINDMRAYGEHSVTTYYRYFGSWQASLEHAGFEPRQPTQEASETELIDEIDRLATTLGTTPTIEQMNDHGEYWVSTYRNHFGSWSNAVEEAGYEPRRRPSPTDSDLIDELQRLSEEVGHPPSETEILQRSAYNPDTFRRRFGSIAAARDAAGFDTDYDPRKISRAALLAELERVAEELGKTPSEADMREHAQYSIQPYRRAFGSWRAACQAADLQPNDTISTDDLLEALTELADEKGRTPTSTEMDDEGRYSASTYSRRFGSWQDACEAAGLESQPASVSEASLLEELARLAEEVGHTPSRREMREQGRYSASTYQRRFGSWQAACEAAGLEPNQPPDRIEESELLAELRRLASEEGTTPAARDMDAVGAYSSETYRKRFGSWQAACEVAGLDPRDPGVRKDDSSATHR